MFDCNRMAEIKKENCFSMKRTFAFFLLIVLLVTACGSNDAPASNDAAASDAPAAVEEVSVQQDDPLVTVFRAPT